MSRGRHLHLLRIYCANPHLLHNSRLNAILVTWLEHLLNQSLPLCLFLHYFNVESWDSVRVVQLGFLCLSVSHRVSIRLLVGTQAAGITLAGDKVGRGLLLEFFSVLFDAICAPTLLSRSHVAVLIATSHEPRHGWPIRISTDLALRK